MDLYHSDYVVNGKTGFLVAADLDLSQRLDLLANDSVLRRSFGNAAVRHASQFDWDDISQQWAAVFQDAVAKRQLYHQPRAS